MPVRSLRRELLVVRTLVCRRSLRKACLREEGHSTESVLWVSQNDACVPPSSNRKPSSFPSSPALLFARNVILRFIARDLVYIQVHHHSEHGESSVGLGREEAFVVPVPSDEKVEIEGVEVRDVVGLI